MVDTPGRRVWRRRVVSAYPRYGYGGYGAYDASIGGFFRAAAEAAAELVTGASRVASTLIVETSDAMFGRRYAAEQFEEDDIVEGVTTTVTGTATETDVETEEEVIGYAGGGSSICDTFNRAFQDGARVVGRSAERFASEYDAYARPVVVRRRRKIVVETPVATTTTATTSTKATTVTPRPPGTEPGK